MRYIISEIGRVYLTAAEPFSIHRCAPLLFSFPQNKRCFMNLYSLTTHYSLVYCYNTAARVRGRPPLTKRRFVILTLLIVWCARRDGFKRRNE